MNNLLIKLKNNIPLILLAALCLFLLAVNIRMTLFSYNNFDFGKFDLGNMTQMVWNTLHGKFMYLTDYFGANVPRWSMSHVDPIILLVIPFFIFWQTPFTLVVFQLVLVLFSAFIVYAISFEETKSKWVSFCFSLVYLFYPALGFLSSKTAYHGVTLAIPFFLLSFWLFQRMYNHNNFSKKNIVLFWIFAVITMSGKEQIPLYIMLFGIYVLLFKNNDFFTAPDFSFKKPWIKKYLSLAPVKQGLAMAIVGFVWFIMAFFVIIPAYAKYRSDGYNTFATKLGINQETARDVALDNYFLSRYSEFGNSYTSVILGVLTHPDIVVKVALGSGKMENFVQTFEPLAYTPLLYPQIFVLAVPDLLVNYLTSADAGGISEIYNHRISMIIPVLVISVIFFYVALVRMVGKSKFKKATPYVKYIVPVFFVITTLCTSAEYQNPVYMWVSQAVIRRFPVFIAQAKTDASLSSKSSIKIGDKVKVSNLDSKDRECAQKVIKMIPDGASVSGPDYLGSHLSMRPTYAIFPALYDEADYVIVDVFARKIFTVLGISPNMLKEIVYGILKNPDYKFQFGCGNLFVYKKEADPTKSQLLPIQEKLEYSEKYSFPIQEGLTLVDYTLPKDMTAGQNTHVQFVYTKKTSVNLDNYILYISMVNRKTGQVYQMANLPSFGLMETTDWGRNKYYIENVDFLVPEFLDKGDVMFLIGATNTLKSSSIYLGDVEVL